MKYVCGTVINDCVDCFGFLTFIPETKAHGREVA